jgi:hypothetical protein
VSQGLLERWDFDKPEQATVPDVSGKGHPGKLNEGAGAPI